VRRRLALLWLAASARAPPAARAADPTIYVHYQTATCTFRVTDDAGRPVTTIAPGRYQVAVATDLPYGAIGASTDPSDLSGCRGFVQFRLTGPGVSLHTTLDDGDSAFELDTVTFQAGASYVAQDDLDPAATRTTIAVASSGSPPAPAAPASGSRPSSAAASAAPAGAAAGLGTLRGTLTGTVAASGRLTLVAKGRPVSALKPGRYVLKVVDRSRRAGFTLQRVHGAPLVVTGAAFVGSRSLAVTIRPGRWVYFAGGGATYFFTVA
jgi:hypothetical protein